MATPLTGELASRRIGTRSGDLRSLARRTNDRGTRSALVEAAAKQKLGEGSAITSSESNLAERNFTLRQNAGLMESRRRQQFGTTTPFAGAGDATAPKTPSLLDRKGVTSSGAGGNPAAPVPTTNADGLVSAPAMSSPDVAPLREGRIDGMPASQATARSQAVQAAGGPREEFGRSLAERNLGPEVTNDSFRTALADYQRRAAADDPIARAGRGAAYTAATAKPGEVPDPTAEGVGPLQSALLQSRADRAARETREADAFKSDFAAATNSVVAINTSPLKKAPGSKLFGQRDDSGLPVASPSTSLPPSREPAAPWEKPNGVTWSDAPSATAVKESSIERSYGERSTPERGGFTDTLPGAALAAAGRGVGGAATSLYKTWKDQKPYDKKKGTSSIERSLSTSVRR